MRHKTKILVFGSDGFIGSNLIEVLGSEFDVHGTIRVGIKSKNTHRVDLLNKHSIVEVLQSVRPVIVVNVAGIVSKDESSLQNLHFTQNLLEAITESGIKPRLIILSGSAAEYGIVHKKHIPVNEFTPTKPNSIYGNNKLKESTFALEYAKSNKLPVVIARIFNPIGSGMNHSMLIPQILSQLESYKAGKTNVIKVSRLDSMRDYLHVKDVALAVKALVEGSPKEKVYNIGSGKSTSTKELIESILSESKLYNRPEIVESGKTKDPLYAIQADISRISQEFGWKPLYTIDEVVKDLLNEGS